MEITLCFPDGGKLPLLVDFLPRENELISWEGGTYRVRAVVHNLNSYKRTLKVYVFLDPVEPDSEARDLEDSSRGEPL